MRNEKKILPCREDLKTETKEKNSADLVRINFYKERKNRIMYFSGCAAKALIDEVKKRNIYEKKEVSYLTSILNFKLPYINFFFFTV